MVRSRRGAAILFALLVLTPTGVRAQADPVVFEFNLEYTQAGCSGVDNGELHFVGDRVEMYGLVEGRRQLVTTGIASPDGTFSIDDPTVRLKITGRQLPQSVTGTGTFNFGGQSCTFNILGERVGAPAPDPTTSTSPPTVELEEFDPTSTKPLSDGEYAWLMRRRGASQEAIEDALSNATRLATKTNADPEAVALRRYSLILASLAMTQTGGENGRVFAYPLLSAMVAPEANPLVALSPAVRGRTPQAVAAFNRLIRLGITMGL